MVKYRIEKNNGYWTVWQYEKSGGYVTWNHIASKDSWDEALFAVTFLLAAERAMNRTDSFLTFR